jgi:hypothetical protein
LSGLPIGTGSTYCAFDFTVTVVWFHLPGSTALKTWANVQLTGPEMVTLSCREPGADCAGVTL